MNTSALLCMSLAVLSPTLLFAEPCITEAYDRPLPGSTSVEFRASDVPSARYPTFWQTGIYAGFPYRIYSNGEAVVSSQIKRPEWKVEVTCTDTCTYEVTGDVPPEATQAANDIGQCLLGEDKTPETEPVPEPVVAAEPEPVVNTGECEATSVPEGGTVITLQRLLVVAGANPGPIDGFIGSKTLNALSEVLEAEVSANALEQSLEALRLKLCAPK